MANPGTGLGPSLVWGRIHDAAKEDDVSLLRDIVEARNGAPVRDINIQSAGGLTPLHVAALSGSNRCIAYLLARNASINVLDGMGRLAIHWAADGGHAESIMHLVSAGQNVDFQDRNGNTALHLAARNGKISAGQYLISIGANISLRNQRKWTPLETASVPLLREVMEMLETSLPTVNQVRRDHDARRLNSFLLDCGMERYEVNIKDAGYTAHYLLDSCRPVRLSKLNEKAVRAIDKMSQRDYLLLLEAVQTYQGTERCNPFAEALKRQRYFDDNPEEYEKFLAINPDYETNNADGSEYRRKVLPKEKEFMDFMLEVLNELRSNDKQNLFDDILNKKNLDADTPVFPRIQNIVDSGWKDVKVLDFQQIERNIFDGMYQCWEQFQLDCFMMIANVWIFCRAVQSDVTASFKAAVALSIRSVRIFKKYNNGFKKRQAAHHKELKDRKESLRKGWSKIAADKRLRGFLPDRFKEVLLQAEEEGDTEFKNLYSLRFAKVEEAYSHWGYRAKSVHETARFAWEEDVRAARDHHFLVQMLDLTSSRDIGRHFQHPVEDVRSDMHIPGGENPGPFRVQNFVREIVWPMDFSTMRMRLANETVCDHHMLRPQDYYWLEQIQLDWLIIIFDAVVYHNKFHIESKKGFDREQRPPFSVPRAPSAFRLATDQPESFRCKLQWDQPTPKLGEVIIAYEIHIEALSKQPVDPARTLACAGESWVIHLTLGSQDGGESRASDRDSIYNITNTGGDLMVENLRPATVYHVFGRSIGNGGILSPKSGPILEFMTRPFVPEAPSDFRALSVSVDHIVFAWNAPRDNGADTIDYEVEYTDLKFRKTFNGRVGWNTTTFSTASVLREPDGKSALSPGLHLPYKEDFILPATTVQARVRARNSEGWGPWNEDGFLCVQTLPCGPERPFGLAVVSEGENCLDLAWMPPPRSNCINGIIGYILDVSFEGNSGFQTHSEYVRALDLQREFGNIDKRPSLGPKMAIPSVGQRRPSSRLRAHNSLLPSTSTTEPMKPLIRNAHAELDQQNEAPERGNASDGSDGLIRRPEKQSWWEQSEFFGKVWFANDAPATVKRKASTDFPVVNTANNVIVYQVQGPMGWEEEICAIIPQMYFEPIQLANRTQSVLQHTIPFNSPLRWNIFVQDERFTFVLNSRFRIKMSASLAYVYGLVIGRDGWISSPDLQTNGMSAQKSSISGTSVHKLETAMCDLQPVECPHLHRITVPSGCLIRFSVTAKNSIPDLCSKIDSVGSASDCVEYCTKPNLPEPPTNIHAQGVLDSVVIVTWVKPMANEGSEVTHIELFYTTPNGVEECRCLPASREGCDITALLPGQKVKDIKVRSVCKFGPGPFSESVEATTKCCSPTPPRMFRFTSSTESSISFMWNPPEFDGGSSIIEWEICGSFPNGETVKQLILDPLSNSHTFTDIDQASVGKWLLNVAVRCRNEVGWSKSSNKDEGKCTDCPFMHIDTRHVRTGLKSQEQRAAVDALTKAIQLGHQAVANAEHAAHRPVRSKKEMMEAAENSVILAEYSLLDAIEEARASGIKELGVMQPLEDIEARKLLQSLQNKRGRRWGASKRGQQV